MSLFETCIWPRVHDINDHYACTKNELGFMVESTLRLAHFRPVGLELGVCHGRTFAGLAAAMGLLEGHMHGIDHFGLEGSAKEVMETLRQKGIDNYTLTVANTHDAGWNTPVDFLAIDAGHDEANVSLDVSMYIPFVKPGGLVFFDDYDDPFDRESPHWAVRFYADMACALWEDLGIVDHSMRGWRRPF